MASMGRSVSPCTLAWGRDPNRSASRTAISLRRQQPGLSAAPIDSHPYPVPSLLCGPIGNLKLGHGGQDELLIAQDNSPAVYLGRQNAKLVGDLGSGEHGPRLSRLLPPLRLLGALCFLGLPLGRLLVVLRHSRLLLDGLVEFRTSIVQSRSGVNHPDRAKWQRLRRGNVRDRMGQA